MIERYLKKLENRSEGGSSLEDGQLELMVHRQDHRRFLLHLYHDHHLGYVIGIIITRQCLLDDYFGVGESLEEKAFGEGLVARGSHLLVRWGKRRRKGKTDKNKKQHKLPLFVTWVRSIIW